MDPSSAPTYAAFFDGHFAPGCDDFRVVLASAFGSQRSRLVWLTELLRANPELVARLAPTGTVELYETLYAPGGFAPRAPGEVQDRHRLAIVVRCPDEASCREFAGAYQSMEADSSPEAFCGLPRATSGPPQPLALGDLLTREPTSPAQRAHVTCARYRACQARLRPGASPADCDGLPAEAADCAAEQDCSAVVRCIDRQTRAPERPLPPDPPARVPGKPEPRPAVQRSSPPLPVVDY